MRSWPWSVPPLDARPVSAPVQVERQPVGIAHVKTRHLGVILHYTAARGQQPLPCRLQVGHLELEHRARLTTPLHEQPEATGLETRVVRVALEELESHHVGV